MNQTGDWELSPAYDVTVAFNPSGAWTNQHPMSINGKLDRFTQSDFIALGEAGNIKKRLALELIERTQNALSQWLTFAETAGLTEPQAPQIQTLHRALSP